MTSGCSELRGLKGAASRCVIAALSALVLLASPGFTREPPAEGHQSIRIAVERVNVGVIVTDTKGKFVENLRQQDFQVLDNDTPQAITDFAPIDVPGQVLMAVEAGPAVYLLQDSHLFVADSLLGGLSPGDRVAIACYNNAPAPLLNFTADKSSAQAALDQIQFNLGYGNLNLSSSLNTMLDWLAPIPGKKTIVLVLDRKSVV